MNRIDEELGIQGGQGRSADEVLGDAWFFLLAFVVGVIAITTLVGCKLDIPSL